MQYDVTTRNARADATAARVGNSGKLKIYTGSPPANAAASATGTLLATHTLSAPFAPSASGGVLSPTLPTNVNAVASGTAGYWRVTTSGDVVIMQGTVGGTAEETTGELQLNTSNVVSTGPVQISSWTLTEGGQ